MIPCINSSNLQDINLFSHYLKTFGILQFKNFLKIETIKSIKDVTENLFSKVWNSSFPEIILKHKSGAIVPAARYIDDYLEFGMNMGILDLARGLVGDNCIFVGSDVSLFWQGSVVHSDNQLILPQIKFGIYLQDSSSNGDGEFQFIPGTHHSSSIYTDLAYPYSNWPRGGGLNPTLNKLSNNNGYIEPPFFNLPISSGDLIIFDSRLLHGARQVSTLPKERRMITWVFSAHPDSYSDIFYERLLTTRENANLELLKIIEIEILKNGPIYNNDIFENSKLNHYMEMFNYSYEFNNLYGNLRSNSLSDENLNFFTKNRIDFNKFFNK